jgi:hypothetical protein
MPLTSALLAALTLAAGPERILLCRPSLVGDPALARAEPLVEAGRRLAERFLDYPVACQSVEEAARAAGRAGLSHGVFSSALGQPEGTSYLLVLTTSKAAEVARRSLLVPPGGAAEERLREALQGLDRAISRPTARWSSVAGWTLGGVGVAALAAGAVLAAQARDQARRADRATTPGEYLAARDAWKRRRTASGAVLAGGGAALAAGLVLKLAF